MHEAQEKVREFHQAMGQAAPEKPTLDGYPFQLRVKLLLEEVLEFAKASGYAVNYPTAFGPSTPDIGSLQLTQIGEADWADMIDDLCDILYVAYGAFVAMGVDAAPFFDEVQRANMAKLWEDGKPRQRADGKILKPATWTPPDIEGKLKDYLKENT